jgi:ribose transport system ATP-binding protein
VTVPLPDTPLVPPPYVLSLNGIVKQFAGTRALDGANLRVERGTVHGLVGENGAGKSTLIRILAGIHRPDSGTIVVDGSSHAYMTPLRANASGVHFIHQDRLLPPTFTVGEAIFLGREVCRGPWLDRRAMQARAAALLREYFDISLPAGALIGELSTAQQQVVQITRALLAKPSLLVFDEPTAALVKREVDQLLRIIDRLRTQGLSIVYISHYLQEIESLCDCVTVLRNGRDVGTVPAKTTPAVEIARMMVNRELSDMYPKQPVQPGEVVLEVRGLTLGDAYGDISLTVRRGEVVGLTGLVGSGAKELARSLFGLERPDSGELLLDGRRVALRSPRDAVARGLAMVPEDRRGQGVAPTLTVLENITLASLGRFVQWGFLSRRRERSTVAQLISELSIATSGSHARVQELSGGNQQKVVLAKWLSRQSRVYILDEPTVGVDIGAKVEIYRLIGRLAEQGAGVLLLSSDLQELLGLADRISVMYRGRIVRSFAAGEADSDTLLATATGARATTAAALYPEAELIHHASV